MMSEEAIGGIIIFSTFILLILFKIIVEIEFKIRISKEQKKHLLGKYLNYKDFAVMTDEHKLFEKILG